MKPLVVVRSHGDRLSQDVIRHIFYGCRAVVVAVPALQLTAHCQRKYEIAYHPGACGNPKKNPESSTRFGISLFYPACIESRSVRATGFRMAQAGLLTLGSLYRLRLPGNSASGIVQLSSPITAAGPSPNFTGFPFGGTHSPCLQ
jgi:hypothetical protein